MSVQPSVRAIADPIRMEVFSNRLLAIAEDMGSILIRSSFSSNIKERRDASTALFDARGRLVAQADHIPIHLGAMIGAVETILARYRLEDMAPGDAFICNDPYLAGGSHLPDISIITPIHHQGAIRFFAGNIAHHADVGGKTPGSTSGSSRSIFEEGIRLPVIRIARGGVIDEDLLELIAWNTRDPEERLLDLRTQVGTNLRGGAMLTALLDRMGWPAVEQAIEDILTYTERRLKNRIAALPDGEYRFERAMDDDGFPGPQVPIVCTARIAGETLELDFEGSGPEARGAINLPDSAIKASVYYCVKAVLDPGLMPNQGIIDPIRIKAPEGSIVNPRPPAAVAARAVTSNRLCGAVFGALFQALPPDRVMASCNDSTSATSVSGYNHGGTRPTSILRAWAAVLALSLTATAWTLSMSTPSIRRTFRPRRWSSNIRCSSRNIASCPIPAAPAATGAGSAWRARSASWRMAPSSRLGPTRIWFRRRVSSAASLPTSRVSCAIRARTGRRPCIPRLRDW